MATNMIYFYVLSDIDKYRDLKNLEPVLVNNFVTLFYY